jgi:hypothetical protein
LLPPEKTDAKASGKPSRQVNKNGLPFFIYLPAKKIFLRRKQLSEKKNLSTTCWF